MLLNLPDLRILMSISEIHGKIAQLLVWLFRFKGLQFAEWVGQNISSPSVVSRSFFGFKLYLDISRSNAHRLLFLEGERHISEGGILADLASPGDCIVDVGANIGYYMLMLRRFVGEKGRVICFEPEPNNFAELIANVTRNSLTNVELIQAAVGLTNGKTSFSCGLNGMIQQNGLGDIDVDLMSLDSVIKEKVDLLKIDVEGYEAHVLKGAEILIGRFRPVLFLEMHPHLHVPNYSVREIIEFLNKYYSNFKFYETRQMNLLEKILYRYFRDSDISQVTDPEPLLSQTSKGFWIVCGGRD